MGGPENSGEEHDSKRRQSEDFKFTDSVIFRVVEHEELKAQIVEIIEDKIRTSPTHSRTSKQSEPVVAGEDSLLLIKRLSGEPKSPLPLNKRK